MEVILSDLLENYSSEVDEKYCLDVLQEALQSETRDYELYFSPKALPGSITEDIAEVDAEMSALDQKVRALLVENEEDITQYMLRGGTHDKLGSMKALLDQLWEIGTNTEENSVATTTASSNKETTFDEVLLETEFVNKNHRESGEEEEEVKVDNFHSALAKLKARIEANDSNDSGTDSTNLVPVLENLESLTELMELPFLARTSIKTGHYQEAVMLYTYTNSLRSKFTGSSIVEEICKSVLHEIEETMLVGLVTLLSTNVTINSLKKILTYLSSIPPFNTKNHNSLLVVFLSMRYNFIQKEVSTYAIDDDLTNQSLVEMMIKRRIEVLREHIYMSLNVFSNLFTTDKILTYIPLEKQLQDSIEKLLESDEDETNSNEKPDQVDGQEKADDKKKAVEENNNEELQEKTDKIEEQEKPDKIEEQEKADDKKIEEQEKVDDKKKAVEEHNDEDSNKDTERKTDEQTKKEKLDVKSDSERNKKREVETNIPMLEFVANVIQFTLNDMVKNDLHNKVSDSVCLQLIYCSFRLHDINPNFHNLFLNKIFESNLFSTEQLARAVKKRSELASKYSYP